MGAFFTNVQVHVGISAPHMVRAQVIEAVRNWVVQGPFVEGDCEGDNSRTVLIAPAGPEPWLAVYDQETEDQGPLLSELACALTAATGCSAVTVLVHDDDILVLELFTSGQHIDTYDSWPDYFRPLRQAEVEEKTEHPERWHGVLVDKASTDDLRRVFAQKTASPYDLLGQVGLLLGLNRTRAETGFNYILKDKDDPTRFTRLAFCLKGGGDNTVTGVSSLRRMRMRSRASTAVITPRGCSPVSLVRRMLVRSQG